MKRLVAFILTLLVCASIHAADPPVRRPNILFCFADDYGRYASILAKIDGHPSINDVVKTPNIDRVAKSGVVFRNAFVNAPSCTPCRSSLLSGRYFFNTGRGAILNGAVWDSSIPSYPLMLQDSGYHIGKSYKVWSPGTPADAPFGNQKYAYEKAGRQPNNFSEQVTDAVKAGETIEAAREKLFDQVRGNFDALLSARPKDQPWHYWFGPTTTHRTWVKGSGKALWGINPDDLKGKLPSFLPDVPEVREDVADYLGEVQAFDAYVGVLLKKLEESGELENTIVVVAGDHGMPGVPGGKCNLYDFGTSVFLGIKPNGKALTDTGEPRVIDDLVSLMDLAPTFLEIGGVAAPANLNGRSIWPLVTSGKSGQIDPSRTSVIVGRERHVATAREENRPYPMRCIRTKDFLYIRNFEPDRWPMGSPGAIVGTTIPDTNVLEFNTRYGYADMDAGPTKAWLVINRLDPKWAWHLQYAFGKRPAEELYDLRKDPEQVKNVAGDTAYTSQQEQLSAELMKVLTAAGDPRVVGTRDTFEKPPFTEGATEGKRNGRNQSPL